MGKKSEREHMVLLADKLICARCHLRLISKTRQRRALLAAQLLSQGAPITLKSATLVGGAMRLPLWWSGFRRCARSFSNVGSQQTLLSRTAELGNLRPLAGLLHEQGDGHVSGLSLALPIGSESSRSRQVTSIPCASNVCSSIEPIEVLPLHFLMPYVSATFGLIRLASKERILGVGDRRSPVGRLALHRHGWRDRRAASGTQI